MERTLHVILQSYPRKFSIYREGTTMEVNMNVSASREMSLYKQNTDQEILLKTMEKTEEIKQRQQAGEPRVIDKARGEKQGNIDLYA
jgi:hypothetical protein